MHNATTAKGTCNSFEERSPHQYNVDIRNTNILFLAAYRVGNMIVATATKCNALIIGVRHSGPLIATIASLTMMYAKKRIVEKSKEV